MPDRRPRDDDEDDDRPRRRRRDDDDGEYGEYGHGRPRRPQGGAGRVLFVLAGVAVLLIGTCCGGVFLYMQFGPKQITVLDATRTKTGDGGTASVTINVRVGAAGPGGMVRGDYYFMFKAGGRTSVHNLGLTGRSGEFRQAFLTPELAKEPGSVEFWVERRDGDSVARVSNTHTIP